MFGLSFGDAPSQTTPQRISHLSLFTGASDLGTEQGMERRRIDGNTDGGDRNEGLTAQPPANHTHEGTHQADGSGTEASLRQDTLYPHHQAWWSHQTNPPLRKEVGDLQQSLS